MRIIELREWSESYIDSFNSQKRYILENAHNQTIKIDHIGSTAIKRILSKPTIDIQIQCDDPTGFINIFNSFDYIKMGEFGIPGRQFIIHGTMDHRKSHIHVYKFNNEDAIWNIWFVNFLNIHQDYAERYSKIKLLALKNSNNDINVYMKQKEQFILEIKSLFKNAQQGDAPVTVSP